MESLGAYILPGSFFILLGLWNIVQTLRRYFWAQETRSKFAATESYNLDFLCRPVNQWPLEGALKILAAVVGIVVEVSSAFNPDGTFEVGKVQHATMFMAFGLVGVMEMAKYFHAPIPEGADYASLALALAGEGLLINFHAMEGTKMDILLHTFLVYAVFATVVTVILEMSLCQHHVMAPLSRGNLLLLQGTWFWQVGFILYPPLSSWERWREDDHEQLMLATLYFTWHVGIDFVITLLINAVIACRYRKSSLYNRTQVKYSEVLNKDEEGEVEGNRTAEGTLTEEL